MENSASAENKPTPAPAPTSPTITPTVTTTAITLTAEQQESNDPIMRLLVSQMPNGMFMKTNCKLCNSPLRAEAEKMFEEGKAMGAIVKMLADNGSPLSPPTVTTHMHSHYKDLARFERMLDYAENIAAISKRRQTRRETVELTLDVSLVELANAITMPLRGDSRDADRLDMILKTGRSIREAVEQLRSIEGSEEQLTMIQTKVAMAWKTIIESAPPEDKKNRQELALKFKHLLNEEGQKA